MTPQPLLELAKACTPGPYFVGNDDKNMADNYAEHIASGLAVVDTGRESDWPVARFCYWPNAQLIARLNPAVAVRVYEALESLVHPLAMASLLLEGTDAGDKANDGYKRVRAIIRLLDGETTENKS